MLRSFPKYTTEAKTASATRGVFLKKFLLYRCLTKYWSIKRDLEFLLQQYVQIWPLPVNLLSPEKNHYNMKQNTFILKEDMSYFFPQKAELVFSSLELPWLGESLPFLTASLLPFGVQLHLTTHTPRGWERTKLQMCTEKSSLGLTISQQVL